MQNKNSQPQPKPFCRQEVMDWIKSIDPKAYEIVKMAERARMFEPYMDKIIEQTKGFDEYLKQKALGMGFSQTELQIMGFIK